MNRYNIFNYCAAVLTGRIIGLARPSVRLSVRLIWLLTG